MELLIRDPGVGGDDGWLTDAGAEPPPVTAAGSLSCLSQGGRRWILTCGVQAAFLSLYFVSTAPCEGALVYTRNSDQWWMVVDQPILHLHLAPRSALFLECHLCISAASLSTLCPTLSSSYEELWLGRCGCL